jgi:hypothetical protein
LWRGFVQVMRTTPLRRSTLQRSQIRLTELLTFMPSLPEKIKANVFIKIRLSCPVQSFFSD